MLVAIWWGWQPNDPRLMFWYEVLELISAAFQSHWTWQLTDFICGQKGSNTVPSLCLTTNDHVEIQSDQGDQLLPSESSLIRTTVAKNLIWIRPIKCGKSESDQSNVASCEIIGKASGLLFLAQSNLFCGSQSKKVLLLYNVRCSMNNVQWTL